MSKYTPGPWNVWKNGQSIDAHRDADGARNIVAIAQGDNSEQQKANAHLIAAAPDLLEALKFLLDREWQDDDGDELLSKAREMSRAAIAKATGE